MNKTKKYPTVRVNKKWREDTIPCMTICTSVYNRRSTLPRTMTSVDKQSFRDIEYIIVNNGSEESIDDIVEQFMDETDIQVKYIKKQYGGYHTGFNMGLRHARGRFIIYIDSDDELLPKTCETFYDIWQSIPEEKRDEYATLRAQCIDQNGNMTGDLFPEDINILPSSKTRKYFSIAEGEQISCNVTKVLRKYYWPEPEGVTNVASLALWVPVEYYYKTWGSNEVLRIYHKEGEDHMTDFKRKRKKTQQDCRNMFWNDANAANQAEMFCINFFVYLRTILRYCVMYRILKRENSEFVKKYPLSGSKNKFWETFFLLPSFAGAAWYKKTKM